MPRVVKKPGDVFKVPLSRGRHGYAQWLPDGTARFFRKATKSELTVDKVVALPVAFRVIVARPTPSQYGWRKIGKAEVPTDCNEPQPYAKKDIISGALSIYHKGVERAATAAELRGLETLAVWSHPHIAERLDAVVEGRKSKFHEQISAVA
jgi:hypothetical protein